MVKNATNGIYYADCNQYSRFYIEFIIANGAVKFPCFIPIKSIGSKYRVAFSTNVYADITLNADSIEVGIESGTYEGCSVFVYGYK